MRKFFSFILCAFLVSQPFFVSANSAQTDWQGVDANGALLVGENSPVIVEHEELVFDIQEFPLEYYLDESDFLAYGSTATARYTFYNPSDYSVNVSLAFPFGVMPDYSVSYAEPIDGEKYGVSVDGAAIEKSVRHTLTGLGYGFDAQEELSLLHDGYLEDPFYHPDLPVTVYVYQPDVDFSEDETDVFAAIEFAFDGEKTRAFTKGANSPDTLDSSVRMCGFVDEGDLFMVYILGEQQMPPEWKFYEDGSCTKEFEGTMKLLACEEMTFEELVMEKLPQDTNVLETDWYNAVVTSANQTLMDHGVLGMGFILNGNYNPARYLMQWFTYELTFAPGQRIVNEVTVPMYPSIDSNYEPSVYGYTYLLSPASTWSEFGTLDIRINTPFYMVGEQPLAFEKTDSGYTVSLDGLPEGELEFNLSTVAEPEEPKMDLASVMYAANIILQLSWPVFAVAAVCIMIWKIRKSNRKDK